MSRAMNRMVWKLFNSSIIIKQSRVYVKCSYFANSPISVASS